MNNTVSSSNGQAQRKTLASQLDRLDKILDVLSDGINETVTDVVREAVTVAVKQTLETVVHELLNRPEILKALVPQQPTPVATAMPAEPTKGTSKMATFCGWVLTAITGAWAWMTGKAKVLPGKVVEIGATIKTKVVGVGSRLWLLGSKAKEHGAWLIDNAWAQRGTVVIALGVGLGVGLIAYFAGPVLSATICGLGSAASVPAYRFAMDEQQTAA
jgi:hypothetical protein